MRAADVRDVVLAAAVADFSSRPEVDGLYLSGSLAEGRADEHSDIDLRVVVRDVAYETIASLRELLPRGWGPFLFHSAVRANHTVSYFDTLTKIDVFYFRASELTPSPWLSLGTRVLLDRRGVVQRAVSESAGLAFVASKSEIREHVYQAIAGLVESIARLQRAQPIYASRCAAAAIDHLLFADDLLSGRAPFGYSKREVRAPGALTELAIRSIAFPTSGAEAGRYYAEIVAVLDRFVTEDAAAHFTAEERRVVAAALRQIVARARGTF